VHWLDRTSRPLPAQGLIASFNRFCAQHSKQRILTSCLHTCTSDALAIPWPAITLHGKRPGASSCAARGSFPCTFCAHASLSCLSLPKFLTILSDLPGPISCLVAACS
jgi:hypothetical protein